MQNREPRPARAAPIVARRVMPLLPKFGDSRHPDTLPMNRGGIGTRSLNIEPAEERKVERFGWTFAPGDNVMQIENDYDNEVYNGDIGYIDDPSDGELTASFYGRTITYGFGEPDTLVLAYATTIHKGLETSGRGDLSHDAALRHAAVKFALYRVTRARSWSCSLVGRRLSPSRNVSGRRRWSKLSEWLGSKTAVDPDNKGSA
jgi:exodeoxyribonuclease V alpha subunit